MATQNTKPVPQAVENKSEAIAALERKIAEAKSDIAKKALKEKLERLKQEAQDSDVEANKLAMVLLKQRKRIKELAQKDFDALIRRLAKKSEYSFLNNYTREEIIRDMSLKAKPVGWRFKGKNKYKIPSKKQVTEGVKNGSVYYENRPKKSDVSFPAQLGKGGGVGEDKIWEIIYIDKGIQKSELVDGYSAIIEENNWRSKNPNKKFVQIQLHSTKNKHAKGGGVGANSKLQRKVDEVNRLIKLVNDNDLTVVDSSSTWESPMKYQPIVISRGGLKITYKELDLYKYNKTGKQSWEEKKDTILKRDMELDNPLNDIAKWHRKALRENDIMFEDGGEIKTPIIRTQFEEEEYEYGNGGNASEPHRLEKMAAGGGVNNQFAEMSKNVERTRTSVMMKFALAIGLDKANRILSRDWAVSPYNLLSSAVLKGFITIDDIDKNLVEEAINEAEDVDSYYKDSGQGIGSSDMNAFIRNMLRAANVEERKMAKGGGIAFLGSEVGDYDLEQMRGQTYSKGLTIKELNSILKSRFPDSFGFKLYSAKTPEDLRNLIPNYDSYYGITDDSLKVSFNRYHGMHYHVYQGEENTYFDFLLDGSDGNGYIGSFGFKDDGDVPKEYITTFVSFLHNAYGYPFTISHIVN